MDQPPKRACLYARVSAWDKKTQSLESQIEMCREYAAKRGYQVSADLELKEDDRGVSGADYRPPALTRALELARVGRFDVFVTRELDRFARGLAKQLLTEKEFTDASVVVEYVIGEYDDTPEGQLTKHVRAIIAEYERDKIAERMWRGKQRALKRGNVLVQGNPPFGYDYVVTVRSDGPTIRKLAVNEEEAVWVQRIFQWYVFGDGGEPLSQRALAARLTAAAVPTKWDRLYGDTRRIDHGIGRWDISGVSRILSSSTYVGEWVYHAGDGDMVISVPAIVDRQLWELAQRKREQSHTLNRRNTTHEYLLRGRVTCAHCGYSMRGYFVRPSGIYTYAYYRCETAHRGNARRECIIGGNYRADDVDEVVWRELKAMILAKERLDEVLEGARNDETIRHLEEQLALAEKHVTETERKIDRLLDLYIDETYTKETTLRRHERLRSELEGRIKERDKLGAQLAGAQERAQRLYSLQQLTAELRRRLGAGDADFQTRRTVVDILDVRVKLQHEDSHRKWLYLEVDGEPAGRYDLPDNYYRGRK